jgi:hypothetical protein
MLIIIQFFYYTVCTTILSSTIVMRAVYERARELEKVSQDKLENTKQLLSKSGALSLVFILRKVSA